MKWIKEETFSNLNKKMLIKAKSHQILISFCKVPLMNQKIEWFKPQLAYFYTQNYCQNFFTEWICVPSFITDLWLSFGCFTHYYTLILMKKYKFFHNPIKIMIIFGKIHISCGHLLISISISLYTKSGESGALIIYILTAFVPLW